MLSNRALFIQILWSYLDDMSFLMINTMISMSIPGVAQVIAQVLLNLIYFDILYTEEWFPSFLRSLGIVQDQEDEAINIYFEDNGFSSKLLINNIGSTICYLVIYLKAWIVLFILERFNS